MAINGKAKYADKAGNPFQRRLVEWRPDQRYSPHDIIDALQLDLAPAGRPKKERKSKSIRLVGPAPSRTINPDDEVLIPRAEENPVLVALKARGLYKATLESGKHDITCPWVHEHTDGLDHGTAYFEPDETFPVGGFSCRHSHGSKYRIRHCSNSSACNRKEAWNRTTIRVVAGDLHRVVDAAERELATVGGTIRPVG